MRIFLRSWWPPKTSQIRTTSVSRSEKCGGRQAQTLRQATTKQEIFIFTYSKQISHPLGNRNIVVVVTIAAASPSLGSERGCKLGIFEVVGLGSGANAVADDHDWCDDDTRHGLGDRVQLGRGRDSVVAVNGKANERLQNARGEERSDGRVRMMPL